MALGKGILKSKAGWVGWVVGLITAIAGYLIGSTEIDEVFGKAVDQKDEFIIENPIDSDEAA